MPNASDPPNNPFALPSGAAAALSIWEAFPATSAAAGINDAGQVVGYSLVGNGSYATEWSGGSSINLGGLSGSTSSGARGINDAGLDLPWESGELF
jgi:probable HAF family extracellular repeat protein